MAFLDKVKEAGAKGLDKAKDLGEIGKYKVQISSVEGDIKDIYMQIGQALVEKYPEMAAEKFTVDFAKIKELRARIETLNAKIEAVKADADNAPCCKAEACSEEAPASEAEAPAEDAQF